MKTIISEFPKHPLPHVPPAPEPQRPQVPPPTVFVYQKDSWEYKVISKSVAADSQPTEDELNTLGRDGWELVAVVPASGVAQFYLKRLRR
jgi:hypothetical protein